MSSKLSWKSISLWTLIGFTLVVFICFQQIQLTGPRFSIIEHKYFTYNLQVEEPADANQLCHIPRIHPFDPSILNYLFPAKPIKCKVRQKPLTYIDFEGYLRFNDTTLSLSGYQNQDAPSCTYQAVLRPKRNDFKITYGEQKPLPRSGVKLQDEFVYVSCYNFAGLPFYSNIHLHIIPKLKTPSKTSTRYNVLILGIDSLSRLSFIRHLPKTYGYLTEKMNAFVFRGMTKIGDNTFPNLASILTGKSVANHELQVDKQFDDWPCIWKNFSERGYATMFAEDRPDIGLFNYYRQGFINPPTNHYLRPFWLAAESSTIHGLSSNLCFGNVPKHQLQLKYTKDFVLKYSSNNSRPFFGLSFFVELSHDYMSQVSVADDDLTEFLNALHTSGKLSNTFFFFLSDHGHRFDALRETLVGRIEERMPFFAIVVPPTYLQKHSQVIDDMKSNLGRLTSPYDTYFTLLAILLEGDNTVEKFNKVKSFRGFNLLSPVPKNRTCENADIPDHYCICEEEKALNVSDKLSIAAASVLLNNINFMLQELNNTASVCTKLKLKEIRRVDMIVPSDKVISNSRIHFGKLLTDRKASGMMNKLRIIIETDPGGALFESTLIHREDFDEIIVLRDISRINRYGDQSWCVNDTTIKKFCFCRDQL